MITGPGVLFRLRGGGSAPGQTFSRADPTTCATHLSNVGVVTTVAAGILRTSWSDLNTDGILEIPGLLLEDARTNSCLQSQTIGTAPWTNSNITLSADATTAPDGTATADLAKETATVTVTHDNLQDITISSAEFVAVSVFLKPKERTKARIYCSKSTANFDGFYIDVDLIAKTATATAVATGTVNTAARIEPCGYGFYRISAAGALNAGVTSARVNVRLKDASGNETYTGDGVSGLYIWGAQLERLGATATGGAGSYIKTVGSTVSRAADNLLYAFPYRPVSMTLYHKFVNLTNIGLGSDPVLLSISDSASTSPRLLVAQDATTGQCYILHQTAGGTVRSTTAATPTYGDTVELRGILNSDGSVQIGMSVNGAAEVVTTATAALTLAPRWSAENLYVGSVAGIHGGFNRHVNVLALGGVRSMDSCRALV